MRTDVVGAADRERDEGVAYTVRVSRDEAADTDELALLGEVPVGAIEFEVVLRPDQLPYAATFVSMADERGMVAARVALAAVRDAGWPAGRYIAEVGDRYDRLEYTGQVACGEPVEVVPRPPF